MIFLELFYTFFVIGLFGFGGGYGMLSLIQTQTVSIHHWLTTAEFTNIVAISQMTPGPIGINSATYCGYAAVHNAGYGEAMAVLGSATATFALVLPSFVLMVLISKMFMKYIFLIKPLKITAKLLLLSFILYLNFILMTYQILSLLMKLTLKF